MATNKKPRRPYKQRSNERQTLRTMPSVLKWVLEPLQQMLDDLREIGCISTDEDGMPLMLDRHMGVCFSFSAAAKGMLIEFEIMFDKYKADKSRLDPIRVLFDHIEKDEGVTESELANAEKAMDYIRAVLGKVTVREYRELYLTWKKVHHEDPSYFGAEKRQIKM